MTWKNAPSVGRHTLLALGLAIVMLAAPAVGSAEEITIEIAPATLNLQSNGKVVTVHTDVPFGDIDVATVYLAGVAINSWKADDRGYFVAKFLIDDIKTLDGLKINDFNTLKFVALTIYDEEVWGEADVMVIDSGTGGNAN
jgi:hypothetical protein